MSIIDKVKEMLGQHPDQAKQAVNKVGDKLDQKTGGKYSDKIDKAQDSADKFVDGSNKNPGQGQPRH